MDDASYKFGFLHGDLPGVAARIDDPRLSRLGLVWRGNSIAMTLQLGVTVSFPVAERDLSMAAIRRSLAHFYFLPPKPSHVLTQGGAALFRQEQNSHRALAVWLAHLLLGEALPPGANEDFMTCKPFAEIAAATFHLAVAVHRESTSHFLADYGSPASLWFGCMWSNAERGKHQLGLDGHPELKGKREKHKSFSLLLSQIEKHQWAPSPQAVAGDVTAWLLMDAQSLASRDGMFDDDSLKPFIRKIRGEMKKMKHSANIQLAYLLPDDSIYQTGGGKRLDWKKPAL
jgi:hypothetical protein